MNPPARLPTATPDPGHGASADFPPPGPETPTPRFDRLDALRGLAMVWMTAFHFCFDLSYFKVIVEDFYRDPFWTWQRSGIVSLFLLCAGMGQAVALSQGQTAYRFWRRWGQVMACALLVSIGSWWMFPRSYISFGVLHGMALMLILVRFGFARLPTLALWGLGALAIALPFLVAHPFFDARTTNWVGLVTRKPLTEDYVPLLPWLGPMLWGCALMRTASVRRWMQRPLRPAWRPLSVMGQWSLSYYMVHQPVMIGALMAARHFGWL
nr:heparan-alpha-glucosaminide N-acetyltransferase [uncultured Roseateles sp.]